MSSNKKQKPTKAGKDTSLNRTFVRRFHFFIYLTLLLTAMGWVTTFTICTVKNHYLQSKSIASLIGSRALPIVSKQNIDKHQLASLLEEIAYVNTLNHVAVYDNHDHIIATWERHPDTNNNNLGQKIRSGGFKIRRGELLYRHGMHTADGKGFTVQTALSLQKALSSLLTILAIGYIAIIILVVIGMKLTGNYLNKNIITPIVKLAQCSDTLTKQHDLSVEIPVFGNNEISTLATNIKELVTKIISIMTNIKDCTEKLEYITQVLHTTGSEINNISKTLVQQSGKSISSINSLNDSFEGISTKLDDLSTQSDTETGAIYNMSLLNHNLSAEVSNLAKNINSTIQASQEITRHTSTNSSNIEQISALTKTMTKAINNLSIYSSESDRLVDEANELASILCTSSAEGLHSLQNMLTSLNNIQQTAYNVEQAIEALVQEVMSISAILHIIEDLTQQTNMLTINASILSAQAGSQGRGFSVVANEISTLATKTGDATQKIGALVSDIQNAINNAVFNIYAGHNLIKDGITIENRAIATFTGIQNTAKESASPTQQLSSLLKDELESINYTSSAINRLSDVIEQIRTLAEQEVSEAAVLSSITLKQVGLHHEIERSSKDQSIVAENTMNVIKKYNELISQANKIQQGQSKNVKNVLMLIDNLNQQTEVQDHEVEQLDNIIGDIKSNIVNINETIKKINI